MFPKKQIAPLTEELTAAVREGAAPEEILTRFASLLTVYRAAKMDWSYTLDQLSALVLPCGSTLVDPLVARLDQLDQQIVEDRSPRFELVPKLRDSDWEKARYHDAALRITLLRLIAETGGSFPPELDRLLLPQPVRLFEVAPKDGGTQHTFIATFFGVLAKRVQALFQSLPEERAVAIVGAWRAFAPSKNLEQNLELLFKRRKEVLRAAPRSPSLLERCRELALRTDLPCSERVYLLISRSGGSLSRIGARSSELGDLPLVLDLAAVPELAAAFPDQRALCVLADDSVVTLDEARAQAIEGGRGFALAPLDVPPEVFHAFGDDGPLGQLHTLLRRADGRALGLPFPLQEPIPESAPDFVFEASAETLGRNLGDAGKLFVYRDHAHWESA